MRYTKIGRTDINASVVALGTWAMAGDSNWGSSDDKESIEVIHRAIDLGINLIDTAPAYGFGHSEEVLGQALAGKRDKVFVSTKCGLRWDADSGYVQMERDGVVLRRVLTPDSIRLEVERSLKNLKTDYIDIYITHWQTMSGFDPAIAVTMQTLLELKKAGKIRGIGIANVTADQIKEYAAQGQLDLVQNKYSMLDRDAQKDILQLCADKGVTFQPYSPLERGILAGKITADTQVTGRARAANKWYLPENRAKVLAMLDKMRPLCGKYQCSLSALVVAWTAAQSPNINVLCGSRHLAQIQENADGGNVPLDPADIRAMDNCLNTVLA
ncbi:MAG: aldo/keto reductase [Spirochaetaceae bacterium]|jgi:methylglyoxal reductase|nr:aldo/keto reductase [Spirochaetaceae bacterium]